MSQSLDKYTHIHEVQKRQKKSSQSQSSFKLPSIDRSYINESLGNKQRERVPLINHSLLRRQEEILNRYVPVSRSAINEEDVILPVKHTRKYVLSSGNQLHTPISVKKEISELNSKFQLPKLNPLVRQQFQSLQETNSNQSKIKINIENYKQTLLDTPTSQKIQSHVYSVGEIGVFTLPGMTVSGVQKINQDSVIVEPEFSIYAVADGHGHGGERISGYLRTNIPRSLAKIFPTQPAPFSIIRDSFIRVFKDINAEIWNSKFDCSLAGSTLSLVYIGQNKIYTANVGDSRAVLGKKSERDGWKSYDLTRDQKPSVEEEAKRIIHSGGRVQHQIGRQLEKIFKIRSDSQGNPIGPLRVWMKTVQAPGLAMTRSFGDKVGAAAGVIATPGMKYQIKYMKEVIEFNMTPQDRFIIVASDGIWEYMTSFEVVTFIGQQLDKGIHPQIISERLVGKAVDVWRQRSLQRDDISCVILVFQ